MIKLKRLEFIITYACSSNCKHCSLGEKLKTGGHLSAEKMKGILGKLHNYYDLESVMCFGGEPLLFYKDVEGIMEEMGNVPKKQIITNGYFNKNRAETERAVWGLNRAGVTDILLSVDVFHQETIPLEVVLEFAGMVVRYGIPIKVHPAWLVHKEHNNRFNETTKELLTGFINMGIPVSSGNNITPTGNAIKYLNEFYSDVKPNMNFKCGEIKYTPNLDRVDTVTIGPGGEVLICGIKIGNIFERDIINILNDYNPRDNPISKSLVDGGIKGLIDYSLAKGILTNYKECKTACEICHKITDELQKA